MHTSSDVKRCITVFVDWADITQGRDEDASDSRMTITSGRMKWSISVLFESTNHGQQHQGHEQEA